MSTRELKAIVEVCSDDKVIRCCSFYSLTAAIKFISNHRGHTFGCYSYHLYLSDRPDFLNIQ